MELKRVVLKRYPEGTLQKEDMAIISEPVPELADDQVLLQVEHLSIDAFIRTTFNQGAFHGTADLDQPIVALGIGRVVDSRFDGLNQGDAVFGPMGAQTYAVLPGAMLQKVDESNLPARAHLGVLGVTTGLTAYSGVVRVGQVQPGDTVVVSAAAGAVGSCACQIAKNCGARVIGIAGGAEKCRFLIDEIGCDEAIDYKNESVSDRLAELVPDGLDVFFDNVGGDVLDAALLNLKEGARVVICGAISQYERSGDVRGPINYLKIPERNASMLGYTVFRFAEEYDQIREALEDWVLSGQLKLPEQIEQGIDSFPDALIKLFTGGHKGKLLVAP